MKRLTLRQQIALWSALFAGLAITIFGAVVAYQLHAEHVEALDGQLAAAARVIFARSSDRGELRLEEPGWFSSRSSSRGALHGYLTGPADGGELTRAYPAKLARAIENWPPTRKRFTRTVDGTPLRFGAFESGGRMLVLAASLEPAEESVIDLVQAYAIALPLVLLFVAGGSWWIARRALRPIVEITRLAGSITANRLGERLPGPAANDEIGRHILVLNGMFDRLQGNFEQATRFSADAAHELRTPLTIMRGQIEEALRSGRAGAEQERLLVDLLEETTGLQKISDNLLLLARFDAGKNELLRDPVDLSALLAEMVDDAELLAAPKGLKVAAEIAPSLRVEGDAVMLRRLALNLLDNAVKFNRPEGEVKLALRAEGASTVVIVVGNSGQGIPVERRAALFERFSRMAADRNRESGGSGLGLSLCREIAIAHGGQIELIRAEGDWTEFGVRLPRPGVAS